MQATFMRNSYKYVPNISNNFYQKFIKSSYELHTGSYEFHMNFTQILYEIYIWNTNALDTKFMRLIFHTNSIRISYETHMDFTNVLLFYIKQKRDS